MEATIATTAIIVILDMVTTTTITLTGIVGVEVIRDTLKRMITELGAFGVLGYRDGNFTTSRSYMIFYPVIMHV